MTEDAEIVDGDDERDPGAERAAVAGAVEDVDPVARRVRSGSAPRYQRTSRATFAGRDAPGNGVATDVDAVERREQVPDVASRARLGQLERGDVDPDAEFRLWRTHTRAAWPLRMRAM